MIAMSPPLRRSIQSIIKVTSDQLALQNEADQIINIDKGGYLIGQTSETFTNHEDEIDEAAAGATDYKMDHRDDSLERSLTDTGFFNREENY